MGSTQRRGKPAGWPLWLLIAAWFCANAPQSLVFGLGVWCGGARHFSHQERLKEEVAGLLCGNKASNGFHAVPAVPAKPMPSPIPEGAVLKKLDLSAEAAGDVPTPRLGAHVHSPRRDDHGQGMRAAPLLTPPRDQAIA
jgi:hypothetical protein